jgi:uncharacterized protein (TIGR00369 family)
MNPILAKYNEVNTFGRELGLVLTVLEPGTIEYRLRIAERHLSNPLAAHGGAIAAMMDGVLGVAALSLSVEDGRLVSTVEFKINYYAPIAVGDELLGRGKVVFAGRRLMSSEGTIWCVNKNMEVVCKGLGTFNAYPAHKNSLFAM